MSSSAAATQFMGTRRYRVRHRVGAGAFGVVYLADDLERHATVALKTLVRVEPAGLYRFKQEFRSLADVVHPNLVALHELTADGDQWFFTMEYVDGVDFLSHTRVATDDTLDGHSSEPNTIDHIGLPAGPSAAHVARIRSATVQLAQGVVALHAAGKLHRDVKPSNIRVSPEGRVVLLDFGLVAELDPQRHSRPSDPYLIGTAPYMAPEQGTAEPLSEATDWYAVGAVLYESLVWQTPFSGPPMRVINEKRRADPPRPREVVADVPSDLDALCMDLLARKPGDRPDGAEVLRRLGAQGGRTRHIAPARSGRRPTQFVGRARELAELDEAFELSRSGRPVVALIRGASGIGKTALVQQLLDRIGGSGGALVLGGKCYERESVPFKALDALIDELSWHLLSLDAETLDGLLPPDIASLARVFPVLLRVDAIADAPWEGAPQQSPIELRRRVFGALRGLLARVAKRLPLVLCIDDVQWDDSDSAAFLADLLGADCPALLLVACVRAETEDSSYIVHAVREIASGPSRAVDVRIVDIGALAADEARGLALTLLPMHVAGRSERADSAVSEAHGSPFFLTQLVLHEGGGSTAEGTVLRLDDLLRLRVGRLDTASRGLLEVVAVAGRPIAQSTASEAARARGQDLSALGRLRSEGLVRTDGPGAGDAVDTFHDRVREVVLAGLDGDTRQRHHRRLAAALAAAGHADPELLAEHFAGAGENGVAARYAAAAAHAAAAALAFDRAAALYRRAIDLGPATPEEVHAHFVEMADALANAGRGADAAGAYLQAAEDGPSERALDLRRRAAEQLLRTGHIERGTTVLAQALLPLGMRLATSPKRALASLLWRRARLRLRGLDFVERAEATVPRDMLARLDAAWTGWVGLANVDHIRAADFQTRHLLYALDAGEPGRLCRALAGEAVNLATVSRRGVARARHIVERARGLAERLGSAHALAFVEFATAVTAFQECQWADAADHCARAEAIFRSRCSGVSWEMTTSGAVHMAALYFSGRLRELADHVPSRLQEATHQSDLYGMSTYRTQLANVAWLLSDEPDVARHHANLAERSLPVGTFQTQHYFTLGTHAQLDLYLGDGAAAWRRFEAAWPAISGSLIMRIQLVRIELHELRARSAVAASRAAADPKPLLASALRDTKRLEGEGTPFATRRARMLRAAIAAREGDRAGALAHLVAAERGFRESDMRLHAAIAARRRGELSGGDVGVALLAASDAYFDEQRVASPERLSAMLGPGFMSRK